MISRINGKVRIIIYFLRIVIKMKNSEIAYYVGLGIVAGTHIYMLQYGMKSSETVLHAWANLASVGLIGYGYVDNRKPSAL